METRSDSPRWLIDFPCPRCGGAISLEETERIFTCAWCRVKLCMGSSGPLECSIPAAADPVDPVLYVPYWRMKGMQFTCTQGEIKAGAVDISHIALEANILPWSLGIRPQLSRLRLLTPDMKGTFFAPTLPFEEALTGYESSMKLLGASPWTDPAIHRSYIGEQKSLLYYPLLRQNGMIADALQDRRFGAASSWEALSLKEMKPEARVRFYAATCPDCGVDLDGERDSLTLTCRNCDRAWRRESEGLKEMPFYVIPEQRGKDSFALPFWRIAIDVEGYALQSFADYVRFCNLPRAITPAMKNAPFHFWVPAFKVSASLFLTLIRRMTLYQWQGDFEKRLGGLKSHPVTMPADECAESLRTAMADLVADKRGLWPKLGEMKITLKESLLVYLPFEVRGGELVQPKIPLGIQRNALQYGLNI